MMPSSIIRLTPPGRGAVASFLLCGEGADNLFLPHWHGKTPIDKHPMWGRLQLNDTGDCEEAVVCRADDGRIAVFRMLPTRRGSELGVAS